VSVYCVGGDVVSVLDARGNGGSVRDAGQDEVSACGEGQDVVSIGHVRVDEGVGVLCRLGSDYERRIINEYNTG